MSSIPIYDFDRVIDRRNTSSFKWDQGAALFGRADILPMWVADMDFQAPPEVVRAIEERASHGIYGYTTRTNAYYDAVIDWHRRRHNWTIDRASLSTSPGVVTTLSLLVNILTEPGDGVIIQAPVYYPFYDVIRLNGRTVVNNTLLLQDGKYVMNLEQLEQQMADGAKLMLFCSPHNPGGRVWTREELQALGELALKYRVPIVSDEIHGDLILRGHRHTPLASISEDIAMNTMTCTSPTKTFNLAGLQTSHVIISDANIRKKYNERLKALSLHMESYFGLTAVESAYRYGEPWLEQLLDYVQGNLDLLVERFSSELPECKVMEPEGTYLAWIDCRSLSPDPAKLRKLMYEEAGVAFNEGSGYGSEGAGFLRINLACPRSLFEEGITRFIRAAREYLSRR